MHEVRSKSTRSRKTTEHYHPWRHAEELGVHVVIEDMDDEMCGWWDADSRTIHLARGITQRQRRATLAHEVEHASHDDRPLLDAVLHARRERATDAAAARRLITVPLLIEALRWTGNARELADELWVDVPTVHMRLACLTDREKARIQVALAAEAVA